MALKAASIVVAIEAIIGAVFAQIGNGVFVKSRRTLDSTQIIRSQKVFYRASGAKCFRHATCTALRAAFTNSCKIIVIALHASTPRTNILQFSKINSSIAFKA